MHTIGACLMVLGVVLIIAANMLHFKTEAEVMEKRPELYDKLYLWNVVRRHGVLEEAYKAEFPNGSRIRQSWTCGIFGFLALISGFLLIVNFK